MSESTKQGEQIDQLNETYGLPGFIRVEAGAGGLPKVLLTCDSARGELFLQGAHVTAFEPDGDEPLIFLARSARYEQGKAIRGGVPICFPWFGSKVGDSSAPSHGLARTKAWSIGSTRHDEHGVELALVTTIEPFHVTYTVRVSSSLTLTMVVVNESERSERFEQALHTYLAVSDIRKVEVRGLQGATYLDQLQGRAKCVERAPAIRFNGETDRIYLSTEPRKTVVDPGLGREILIDTEGARSTVIWNPWIEKTDRMSDLEQDEWPKMLCVETGNIADDAVELAPGERWRLSTILKSQRTEI